MEERKNIALQRIKKLDKSITAKKYKQKNPIAIYNKNRIDAKHSEIISGWQS